MIFGRRMALVVVVAAACLFSACALDDCGVVQSGRVASTIKTMQDSRTGLCFVYSVERGGSRYGLSQVDCATVEHSLAWHADASARLVGQLRYGQMTSAADQTLCLAYAEDDGGNMRSNLAVVSCEPVLGARERSRVEVRQMYP